MIPRVRCSLLIARQVNSGQAGLRWAWEGSLAGRTTRSMARHGHSCHMVGDEHSYDIAWHWFEMGVPGPWDEGVGRSPRKASGTSNRAIKACWSPQGPGTCAQLNQLSYQNGLDYYRGVTSVFHAPRVYPRCSNSCHFASYSYGGFTLLMPV